MSAAYRFTIPFLLTCAMVVAGAGCHPKEQPHKAVPKLEAVPPPPASSNGGFPTPDEAFRDVKLQLGEPQLGAIAPHADRIVPIKGGFALLIRRAETSCHGCTGQLSIAYFHRTAGRWSPYRTWQDIHETGTWGEFDVDVLRGGEVPLLAVKGDGMFGGCYFSEVGLIELTPARPVVRVRMAPLESDNSGRTEDPAKLLSFSGEIAPLQKAPGVKIHYTGVLEHGRRVDQVISYTGPGPRWRPHPHLFPHGCDDGWKYADPK